MPNKIIVFREFERNAKKLAKKYRSFQQDLRKLVNELRDDALMGTSLGGNLRKVRLLVKSKGVGKSGGARIITYFLLLEHTVYLVAAYDKAELSTIPVDQLKILVDEIESERKNQSE